LYLQNRNSQKQTL